MPRQCWTFTEISRCKRICLFSIGSSTPGGSTNLHFARELLTGSLSSLSGISRTLCLGSAVVACFYGSRSQASFLRVLRTLQVVAFKVSSCIL
jgi:hypothetical protein